MTMGIETSRDEPSRKKGWPKGRKRKLLPKDINAPKGPLSGYVLFMNDQRELVKQDNSKASFSEVARIISNKWAHLGEAEKQKYLDAAEIDKERYQQEFETYQKTESYKRYIEQEENERKKLNSNETGYETGDKYKSSKNKNNISEVCIFTEEFLNHNKGREIKLRQLRKSNTDYEERNAALLKRIESIRNYSEGFLLHRSALAKLTDDSGTKKDNLTALIEHMTTLRSTLMNSFSEIEIPGLNETAKEGNLDSYILKLHDVLTTNPSQHQKLVHQVKNIVNNLSNR